MIWRTDRPTEKVIVAKLSEDFCHAKDRYAVLYLANEPYQHYSENGEEIPYAAIEKWALLEEQSSEDLEEAAEKYFYSHWSDGSLDIKDDVIADFIAGAEWQKEQMMKGAVEEVVQDASEDIEPWLVVDVGKFGVKHGDKVKIIIV